DLDLHRNRDRAGRRLGRSGRQRWRGGGRRRVRWGDLDRHLRGRRRDREHADELERLEEPPQLGAAIVVVAEELAQGAAVAEDGVQAGLEEERRERAEERSALVDEADDFA